MLDRTPDELYELGSLLFLDTSTYEDFNATNKTFIKMAPIQMKNAIAEAIRLLNVTFLKREKDSCISMTGRTIGVSRNRMTASLESVNKTSCSLTKHLTKDGRGKLETFIQEIIEDVAAGTDTVVLRADVYLHIKKFRSCRT